jgi:DNA polymerase IV (DinB-like DNA polymerase)
LNRIIGHLDLDYFYAQVEEVLDPRLRSRPVLVCVFSGRTEESGVISTANYKAREFGVRSGMPISLAKKRVQGKDAIFIPMQHPKYEAVSERVMQAVREGVDILEQAGIDEAFFDITKVSSGDYTKAETLASNLKHRIMESEGLTSSIGIAPNKVVAKLASDFQKPNGLTVVRPENVRRFLEPLEVTKLYGVGPKTAERLNGANVRTIGELAAFDTLALEKLFTKKLAIYLRDASSGLNEDPVVENSKITQLSRIVTLRKNTRDAEEAFDQLSPVINDLHSKLLSKNLSFKSVSVIGILTDLSIRTKNRTLGAPTSDPEVLRTQVQELLRELTGSIERELRRVGARVSDLANVADQTPLTQYLG